MKESRRADAPWIAGFFALTFLLLGLIPLLAWATGASLDFGDAAKRASQATGVTWTSNIVSVLRLAIAEPSLWLLILGSGVPSLAALVICAARGSHDVQRLLVRFLPICGTARPREALKAYLFLGVAVPICLLAVYGIRRVLSGPDYVQPVDVAGPGIVFMLLSSAFLDQGGLLEELGWRGYGQVELQKRLMSPLSAALVVGIAWGLWHVPRDIVGGVAERYGWLSYCLVYLPTFLAGTIATSILAAYFVNRAGGSVIPAIMVHGLTNDAAGLSGVATIDVALSPHHQLTKAIPFLVLALVLVVKAGRNLGKAPVAPYAEGRTL